MLKVFTVLSAVIVVFFLLTAQVNAQVSCYWPPTVEWRNFVGSDTTIFVCPSGDGSSLHVVLKDCLNLPVVGQLITATFTSSCNVCLCSPVQGTTDNNGEVNLTIRGGLDASGGPACCSVKTTLVSAIYTLYSDQRDWVSSDLNGDCAVSAADAAIVMGDMGLNSCRSDYNCDGLVNTDDYNLLLDHIAHSCGPISVESTTWGAIKSVFR